jgi:hypothetical protein
MTIHRQRALLWVASAAVAAAGALALALAALMPLDVPGGRGRARSAPASTRPGIERGRTLEEFAAIWDKSLRTPADGVSPQARQASEKVVPTPQIPPPFRLAGTVVERGHSYALLVTPDGRVEVKAAGEECSGATVEEVMERAVTLRIDGRLVTLELPQPG